MNESIREYLFAGLLGLLLVIGLLLTSGCGLLESSPTEPAAIFTNGTCSAPAAGQISCRDETEWVGGDRDVTLITWDVIDWTDTRVASDEVEPGGETVFRGLVAGNYTVEQVPVLDNGERGPKLVHGVFVQ